MFKKYLITLNVIHFNTSISLVTSFIRIVWMG